MTGIIVADAGPLHYIILIDCSEVLPKLFERVLIPPEVRDELLHDSTPPKVKDWVMKPPVWLKVEPVKHFQAVAGLHTGEAAALQLALETKTLAVLMDDLDGRSAARRLGLAVIGTIGILEKMAESGTIDLSAAFTKLRQTNFFVSPELLDAALARDRQRHES
jgi:predicted nucleic acid-binding protein